MIHYKNKKFTTAILSATLLFTIFAPNALNAQGTAVPTADIELQKQAQLFAEERLKAETEKEVKADLQFAFINSALGAVNFFFSKLAYDLATDIATSGTGKEPLIFTQNWKDYLTNTALNTLGDFMGRLSNSDWKLLNLDFCDPSFSVKLQILISLYHEAEPKPKCEWQDIKNNYGALADKFSTGPKAQRTLLSMVGYQFRQGGNDLGIALNVNDALRQERWLGEQAAREERQEGRGFRGVLSPISKSIQTPAVTIEGKLDEAVSKHPGKAQDVAINNLFLNSDVLVSLGANVASVFANTLVEKLVTRVFEGLFPAYEIAPPNIPNPGESGLADEGSQSVTNNPSSIETAYGDLLTAQVAQITNYNPINEFTTCNATARGANHCVIDQGFATAINSAASGEPLTIKQAIERGYLLADWPLISTNNPKNTDPFCYSQGYCESNLKKLRHARIIPVGWEIAASKSPRENPVTLGEVVNNFKNCGPNGTIDATHPWCHLIDPSWVLKLPLTQCRALVYGATRISIDSSDREQVCVDAPTCIEENEKGECVGGFGYCSREKRVWKLGGDSCPAQAASCLTLKPRRGKNVNYLLDTVDDRACNESNVGCRGYSLEKDSSGAWSGSRAIYLDKEATACKDQNAGCAELISKKNGAPFNLLENSSFEKDEDGNKVPDGWSFVSGGADTEVTGSSAETYFYSSTLAPFIGSRAVRVPGFKQETPLDQMKSLKYSKSLVINPNTIYTFSVYTHFGDNTRLGGGGFANAALYLSNLSIVESTCGMPLNSDRIIFSVAPTSPNNYQRFSCIFKTSDGTPEPAFRLALGLGFTETTDRSKPFDGGLLIDAIQLEEGAQATTYLETGYGQIEKVYLKAPPAYLGCTGDLTDREECKKYARVCLPEEVGCELYAPTNGNPGVPGIVGSADRCPAECVGYGTFKQEATKFEASRFPLYFIPKTGQSCTASAVGCDEFTNLDAIATGGEGREYFSSIRMCQKPAPDSATFYTWEGSDTVGYQLKVWNLKKSNFNNGPCTKLNSTNPSICADYGGVCNQATMATNPDCREFYDASGNIYYRLYSKTITSTDDCHPYRKTISDLANCGATGGLWNTQTGVCTYKIYPAESGECQKQESGCRAYTGNTGKNVRNIFNDTFDDGTVGDWQGGSPSSEAINTGGTSLTSKKLVITRPLEGPRAPSQGKIYLLEFWAKGVSKSGGLDIRFRNPPFSGPSFSGAPGTPTVNLGTEWKQYSLGPITHLRSLPTGEILLISNFSLIYIDNIVLREVSENIYLIKDSWNTPNSCNETLNGDPLPQAMLGCEEYKDRASTTHNLKSFDRLCREEVIGCEAFINTQNSEAINSEAYNLYCQLDSVCAEDQGCACRVNTFSLCTPGQPCVTPPPPPTKCTVLKGEESCTYNLNSEPGINDLNICPATGLDSGCVSQGTVVVPRDENTYLVNSPAFACDAGVKGCSALGEQKFSQNCTLDSSCLLASGCVCSKNGSSCTVQENEKSCVFKNPPGEVATKYLLNQPDNYSNSLCSLRAEGCELFTSPSSGQNHYFKTPEDQLCEYRDTPQPVGGSGSGNLRGWYKKGTDDPCGYIDTTPTDASSLRSPYLIGSAEYGAWKNGDKDYEGYVGECQAKYSGCTIFADGFDKLDDAYPKGKQYSYLKNQKISGGDCNGQVNPSRGCVLLRDSSIPSVYYNAELTYQLSQDAGDKDVAPATCDGNVMCGKRCLINNRYEKFCNSSGDCGSGACVDLSPTISGCMNRNLDGSFSRVNKPSGGGDACLSDAQCPSPAKCLPKSDLRGVDDSNAVIKAKPDRTCSDWLACKTSTSIWDPKINSVREFCTEYARCVEYLPSPTGVICKRFAKSETKAVLTDTLYSARNVNLNGQDFSGFSAPGLFQLSVMTQVDSKLGISQIGGSTIKASASCRAYPEADSPFPSSVTGLDKSWANANVCKAGEQCECRYNKLSYGADASYINFNTGNFAPGVCAGGSRSGLSCVPGATFRQDPRIVCDATADGGICEPLERYDRLMGVRGFCLEPDKSVAINGRIDQFNCLSWYPSDLVLGETDIYNFYEKAGAIGNTVNQGGRFYCAEAEGNQDFIDTRQYSDDEPAEVCQLVVDVGSGAETIYVRTDRLTNVGLNLYKGAATDPKLNYKYAHSVSPFGSAEPRLFEPIQTGKLPWVSYNKQSCTLENPTFIYRYCWQSYKDGTAGCDEKDTVDGDLSPDAGCFLKIQRVPESGYGRAFCDEKDGCMCEMNAGGGKAICTVDYGDETCVDQDVMASTPGGLIQVGPQVCNIGDGDGTNRDIEDDDCVDNPTTNTPVTYRFFGPYCKELDGCVVESWKEDGGKYKCAEGDGCDCGSDILMCAISSGASSCNYFEKLPYGGIPWSCEGNCGQISGTPRVLGPQGDFDPETLGDSSAYRWSQGTASQTVKDGVFGYIFSWIQRVFPWDGDKYLAPYICGSSGSEPNCFDKSKLIVSGNDATPKISAIEADGTLPWEDGKLIFDDSQKISVNGVYEGGVIGGRGKSFSANLQFAYWTKSHGPITSIKIDWDDTSALFETKGSKYKNKIPKREISDQGCSLLYNALASEPSKGYYSRLSAFAVSQDACEEMPAFFNHTYIYDESDPNCNWNVPGVLRQDIHLSLGIGPNDRHCHFKPRVIVQDNWGYCNGFCPGGEDESDACFDAPVGIFGNSPKQECSMKRCSGGSQFGLSCTSHANCPSALCTFGAKSIAIQGAAISEPGTRFLGTIIVAP